MTEKPKPYRIKRALDEFDDAMDNYVALHDQLLVDGKFPETAYEPLQNAMRRVHEAWGRVAHIMMTQEFYDLAERMFSPVPILLLQQVIRKVSHDET
jgi:hypothetical protein